MAKHSATILELAKIGAVHRYKQLKAELADLVKAFPHLEFGSAVSPSVSRQKYPPPARKRKRMSAAARKAVSVRMKKYWAARRKEKRA
jgi:hypothetical protein